MAVSRNVAIKPEQHKRKLRSASAGAKFAVQPARWVPSAKLTFLIVLAVLLLFAAIRIRLRDVPLERDEGEYAYAGQLMLQGIPPYKLAYNMKLPGTYAAYALILLLFGQTTSAIHIGLLLVNAATTIMMFFLAKQLFGELAGIVAAAAYALLCTGAAILGLQAHASHFVVLAAVAGLLLFLKGSSTGRRSILFSSGMLLGLGFVMKQPGMFFVFFAALQLVQIELRRKQEPLSTLAKLGSFSLGAALPFALTCGLMAIFGVFGRFWFWVFHYARAYGSVMSLEEGLQEFKTNAATVIAPMIGIWGLAAIGATALLWDKSIRKHAIFCFGLLLFSFLAVCPGLFFRPHYFIFMLPAIALLAAVAVTSFTHLFLRNRLGGALAFVPAAVFAGAFGYALFVQSDILFQMDPVSVSRSLYGIEPFPDALKIADYIKPNSDASARIAVLGAEPEIYFYAHRHSATGYIYSFPLAENQPYAETMQREMFSEIETAKPEYLVLHSGGWALGPESRGVDERVDWANRYLQNYTLVARVDTVGSSSTEFRVADAPGPSSMILVFRKKAGAEARQQSVQR